MSTPHFTGVVQIGIVVEDAEGTARRYRDLVGIDGWMVNEIDTANGDGNGFRWQGGPHPTRAKVVWASFGAVELELIEPQDQSSIYAEFLQNHGPGVHHIMFGTTGFDAAGQELREHAVPLVAEGVIQGGRFALYDAQGDLGLIIEIAEGESLVPDRGLS